MERSAAELKVALAKSEAEIDRLNQFIASMKEEMTLLKSGFAAL